MKICSWNVYDKNHSILRILEFVRKSNYDVYCFQEVLLEAVEALKRVEGYHLAYSLHSRCHGEPSTHNVILSKKKIEHSGVIEHVNTRTTMRIDMLSLFIKDYRKVPIMERKTRTLYADIDGIRIFNSHFRLTQTPSAKIRNFEEVYSHRVGDSIFCGDYNILDRYPVRLLNWFISKDFNEAIIYNERKELDKVFEKHNLMNPFRNTQTFKSFHTQLDHIVVPLRITVKSKRIIKDLHGSDHYPIVIEIE